MLSALAMAAAPSPSNPTAAQPLVQRKKLGAVLLTLSTDRQTMGLADRLRLSLSVETPPEMAVIFPRVDGPLGPFTVRGQRLIDPQKTTAHTRQWLQEYILEAEHLGVLTIPPLTVTVQASGAAPTGAPQQLTTEALAITVVPLLPDDADVTAPKDIAPPVALLRPGVPLWMWGAAGVLGSLGLVVGIWCYQRRRPTHRTIPPQSAHVLALAALEQLWREELIAQQRVDEFHVRLSDIVRRYMAWRFGLCAPTQTTDELLAIVCTSEGCLAVHQDLLGALLWRCDLVKFARHQPTPDATQQAWESARAFVERTADAHVVVMAPPSDTAAS
jgi:hypothetical protein